MYKNANKNDTLHQIYSNQKIKQQLLDYVYSKIDLSKYKYNILTNLSDLSLLHTNKFHLSGNYSGSPCLLVFTTNKDRTYSFLLHKKTLTYNKDQINIDTVSIEPVSIGLDEKIYNCTIMDGILAQNDGSQPKTFIITDIYYFRGDDMRQERLKHKIINIKRYLDAYLNQDKNLNDISLMVNQLYDLSTIDTFVNKIIPETKTIPIRGIAFYPDVSSTKLLFLFNQVKQSQGQQYNSVVQNGQLRTFDRNGAIPVRQQFQSQNRQSFGNDYRHQPSQREPIQMHISPVENIKDTDIHRTHTYRYIRKDDNDDAIILTFEIRKTEHSDVYKLFLVSSSNIDNGKSILKTKKIGIAYIPTTACSKMCKELTLANGRALVKCNYDDTKEKWIPIEGDSKKKCPDFIEKLEEKMNMIIDDE